MRYLTVHFGEKAQRDKNENFNIIKSREKIKHCKESKENNGIYVENPLEGMKNLGE